jgi:thiol-disulfide isomerase/thioredoxin
VVLLSGAFGAAGCASRPSAAAGPPAETAAPAAEGARGSADAGSIAAAAVRFTRFDGAETTLAAYRGGPLVVNFFASWCAPCVREMPEFEKVHQELGPQVAFLGIDVRDRLEEGMKLARQTGVTYDLARDPRGEVLAAVKGSVMPTTAFITADGRVALVQSRTYNADDLRAAIHRELLS